MSKDYFCMIFRLSERLVDILLLTVLFVDDGVFWK